MDCKTGHENINDKRSENVIVDNAQWEQKEHVLVKTLTLSEQIQMSRYVKQLKMISRV